MMEVVVEVFETVVSVTPKKLFFGLPFNRTTVLFSKLNLAAFFVLFI